MWKYSPDCISTLITTLVISQALTGYRKPFSCSAAVSEGTGINASHIGSDLCPRSPTLFMAWWGPGRSRWVRDRAPPMVVMAWVRSFPHWVGTVFWWWFRPNLRSVSPNPAKIKSGKVNSARATDEEKRTSVCDMSNEPFYLRY